LTTEEEEEMKKKEEMNHPNKGTGLEKIYK